MAAISPRPLVIIGAREDERTPAGQTELLYPLARAPKRMRRTDGEHIEPDRPVIIAELLQIADEEMAFLAGSELPRGERASDWAARRRGTAI